MQSKIIDRRIVVTSFALTMLISLFLFIMALVQSENVFSEVLFNSSKLLILIPLCSLSQGNYHLKLLLEKKISAFSIFYNYFIIVFAWNILFFISYVIVLKGDYLTLLIASSFIISDVANTLLRAKSRQILAITYERLVVLIVYTCFLYKIEIVLIAINFIWFYSSLMILNIKKFDITKFGIRYDKVSLSTRIEYFVIALITAITQNLFGIIFGGSNDFKNTREMFLILRLGRFLQVLAQSIYQGALLKITRLAENKHLMSTTLKQTQKEILPLLAVCVLFAVCIVMILSLGIDLDQVVSLSALDYVGALVYIAAIIVTVALGPVGLILSQFDQRRTQIAFNLASLIATYTLYVVLDINLLWEILLLASFLTLLPPLFAHMFVRYNVRLKR